jgi:tetratricopeptide (TPR) repeat protein
MIPGTVVRAQSDGRTYALAAAVVLLSAGCSDSPPSPTFNRDIAPIVYEHCAPCHRPGASGPFSLLTYSDLRRHAGEVVEATGTRFMPPWLPLTGLTELQGERRLTDRQIEILRLWLEQGTPEGDPDELPPAPKWEPGWHLGQPDLELSMPAAYTLPAEGQDVYRNFVIPVNELESPRWIRSVELRPGNPAVVHHARILVDRTSDSRRRDAADQQPGFPGMDAGLAHTPDGVLLGWTPGRLPRSGDDDLAWALNGETDIVLQLHMVPSGKPEPVQATLGLHFADQPPRRRPFAFTLGSREIDIPPGEREYLVEESYTMPVDVEALGIYPHAHYLGKTMAVFATLPRGEKRWLLRIDDWDFNWQDEYRFLAPLALPRGSRISMQFTYDNSSDNIRNPSNPPRRVRYGPQSTDEMAEVMLQVMPSSPRDRVTLQQDYVRQKVLRAIAFRRRRIEKHPADPTNHAAIGSSYLELDMPERAIPYLEEAARLDPQDPRSRNSLGYALARVGRLPEAIEAYTSALRVAPDLVEARSNLADALSAQRRWDEAAVEYRGVLESHPDTISALNGLARILSLHPVASRRDPPEAVRLAERAVELNGAREPALLETLAAALAAAGDETRALEVAERASTLLQELAPAD